MEVSVSVSDAGGRSFSLAVPVEGGDTLAALNKVRERTCRRIYYVVILSCILTQN